MQCLLDIMWLYKPSNICFQLWWKMSRKMQLQSLWPFLASRFPVVNHYTLFTVSQPIFNQHESANCSYESQPELLLQTSFPQMPSQAQCLQNSTEDRPFILGMHLEKWAQSQRLWQKPHNAAVLCTSWWLPATPSSWHCCPCPHSSQRQQEGGHHVLPCVLRILDCIVTTSAVFDILPQNPKPQTKCFCPVESALIKLVWAPLLLTKLLPSIVPHQFCSLEASS